MPVKYYLQPNPVTANPNDQKALVAANSVLSVSDIIRRIVNRGSTVGQADATAVLQLAFEEIAAALAEGNNVNTPLVNMRPTVKGVFASAADSFDAGRHKLWATFSAGSLIAEKMATATTQKVSRASVSPNVTAFIDAKTNTNAQASISGIGTIIGTGLKFNLTNPLEGIFFINSADNTETKVADIATHTKGRLVFMVPATLVAGAHCWLEVRKAYTAAQTIRGGRLSQLLTIIA